MSSHRLVHARGSCRRAGWMPFILAGLLTSVLAGPPAMAQTVAEQEEPAQQQQVVLEEAPPEARQGATSLSDFAAATKLQRPEGSENTSLVISNENLGELSKGAVLSEGVAVNPTMPGIGKGFGQQQELERDWRQRLQAQQLRVQDLEDRLSSVDGKVDDYQQAGLYFSSAHYRPGGVQDPVETFRTDLQKQLTTEQQKLDSLRQQARKDGVRYP
jgi:hypothetical protein